MVSLIADQINGCNLSISEQEYNRQKGSNMIHRKDYFVDRPCSGFWWGKYWYLLKGSTGTTILALAIGFFHEHIAPLPGGYAVAVYQEYYGYDFLPSAVRWKAVGQFPYWITLRQSY